MRPRNPKICLQVWLCLLGLANMHTLTQSLQACYIHEAILQRLLCSEDPEALRSWDPAMSKQWSCASLQAGYQAVMGESDAELALQEEMLKKQIEVSCHKPYL